MARNLFVFLLPPLSLLGALVLPPAASGGAALVGVLSAALVMDGLLRPGSRLFGSGLLRGGPQPRVALTFDDGPHPADTPAILEILEKAGVRATFFFVGERARAHPELVRRAARMGHEVGNHSDTHPWWFSLAGPGRIRRELHEADQTLQDLSGHPVRFFRPPMGHNNVFLERALSGTHLTKTLWSSRSFDTVRRSPGRIRDAVIASASPGGIILLHEGAVRSPGKPSGTVAALPSILAGLRDKGLEPVSLGNLRGSA
jgi:peptidoglycan-N-acetylglucosamine deacetylase